MTDIEKKQIEELSLDKGFSNAKIINTKDIVFNFEFRKYCKENLCGNYNENYSCPPLCGTPEMMKEEVLKYNFALVLEKSFLVSNIKNKDVVKNIRIEHNTLMFKLINELKTKGINGKMAGASNCLLCDECAIKKQKPCKHPLLSYSCLSAYCIDVQNLASKCNMNYEFKDSVLSFYGVYFFN